MKKGTSLFLLVLLVYLVTSCSFQKILKNGEPDAKYEAALKMYNEKDYSRALQLFDQLMGVMRTSEKSQKIYYYYAYCYYYQKDYTLGAYYFKRFANNFPNTREAEECMFMSAYCNFLNSADYYLDQSNTYDAIKDLQLFINTYPTSSRIPECNDLIDKLRSKLEFKDYKIAKMYYRMDEYIAAITCLNNILKEYPETARKEDILYLTFKSYYKYAYSSVDQKKKERYGKAFATLNDLVQMFPSSKYLPELNSMKVKAQNEVDRIGALTRKAKQTSENTKQ
ncbi:MAG TPA: outer membrane protein assembly factor BamD [Bacteroidales bacterium]|nr:outer membrane protein assembly factor BamD [Bacteroidales bacterium]